MTIESFIKWFRDSSPYIDAHRGSTFVLCLPSAALDSDSLDNIVSDIALLSSLGVRLVLVFDAETQIESTLKQSGSDWMKSSGHRITTTDQVAAITATTGAVVADLTAKFSFNVPDSPVKKKDITVTSGNFIKARPLGILDGTDHHLTGRVRSVNHDAIKHQLDTGAIVVVSGLGFSPSGETFYLDAVQVAMEVAAAIKSEKLIYLSRFDGIADSDGTVISEIDLSASTQVPADMGEDLAALFEGAAAACKAGVARSHIISYLDDGALLEELFTRDGCGTQVTGHSYEQIRKAAVDDVPGILKLIEPLETAGVLVKRSRELLEAEIEQFVVIERDGLLISCAALYPFEDGFGELACLVTHPDYRKGDRGDRLLDKIEENARALNLEKLFVLTTQSAHWFSERGFIKSEIEKLPAGKQALYNYQRGSTVLSKTL